MRALRGWCISLMLGLVLLGAASCGIKGNPVPPEEAEENGGVWDAGLLASRSGLNSSSAAG